MQVDFYRASGEEQLSTAASREIGRRGYDTIFVSDYVWVNPEDVPALNVYVNSSVGRDLARRYQIQATQYAPKAKPDTVDLSAENGDLFILMCQLGHRRRQLTYKSAMLTLVQTNG